MKQIINISNPISNGNLSILICLMLAWVPIDQVIAQCSPPMAETCEESSVLCSLDELNGYSCNNPSTIPSQCTPLCSNGGNGENTSWWAFVTRGGDVTITLIVGGCITAQGLQFGIWGDCVCGEEIACRSLPCILPNSIQTINVNLKACKTYYLWVDGCSGDICDFTLQTAGGAPPTLSPLGFINNIPRGIIEPICVGACNVTFFVNPQPGNCEPTYVWTLDGDEVGGNSNEIRLDFPHEGDFVICVTAFIGNPQSGSICSQEGPRCAIVKVRPIADKIGIPRILCWAATNPGGFKWHSQRIFTSGFYHEQFTDANCCKYDSVIEFIVLDRPIPLEVLHISCDSNPYIDAFGRSWYGCRNQYPITLDCDSSVLLTTAFFSYDPVWELQCNNGQTIISLNDSNISLCNDFDSIRINYAWFLKEDSTHTILSRTNNIIAHTLGTYCTIIDIAVTSPSNQIATCSKTVCYDLFSDTILAKSNQLGNNLVCIDQHATYSIDAGGIKQEWTADGNPTIHSRDTILNKEIILSWHEPGIKNICIRSYYDQNKSCLMCQKVEVIKAAQAGRDFKVFGLQTKMNANNAQFVTWKVLSGPGNTFFFNSRDPKTRVAVNKVGRYVFELTALQQGCLDKDTITIDFFKIIWRNPGFMLFDANDPEIYKSENRNKSVSPIEFFTPSLIQTNGSTFLSVDEKHSFQQIEYSWMDISGRMILHGKIQTTSCTSMCEIESPINTGMYFLILNVDDQKIVRKIIVME